jgi:DNA-binding transcriptional MerR regulator
MPRGLLRDVPRRTPSSHLRFKRKNRCNVRIGILATRTGTTVPTIRYYEEIGLLRPAIRQSGGQRTYDNEDVRRLSFIRRCREFDFSIEDVRSLLSVMHDRTSSCTEARNLADGHLIKLRRKLAELTALEKTIASLVADCDASCVGGPSTSCVILGDFAKCASMSRSGPV